MESDETAVAAAHDVHSGSIDHRWMRCEGDMNGVHHILHLNLPNVSAEAVQEGVAIAEGAVVVGDKHAVPDSDSNRRSKPVLETAQRLYVVGGIEDIVRSPMEFHNQRQFRGRRSGVVQNALAAVVCVGREDFVGAKSGEWRCAKRRRERGEERKHFVLLRIEQTQKGGAVGAVDPENGSALQQSHQLHRRVRNTITEQPRRRGTRGGDSVAHLSASRKAVEKECVRGEERRGGNAGDEDARIVIGGCGLMINEELELAGEAGKGPDLHGGVMGEDVPTRTQ